MSLADQVYNEVIKKVPTAIRKFGADALGSAIIKAIRSTDTTDIENLADEVIKSLNPKTNEEKNKPILTDDEEKRILSKLLKVFNSISSPEQLKSAKKYYNLALEKLHAKSLDEFYRERGEIGDLALKVSSMISNKEKKYTPVDEGQIYSTGGGCGQAYRKFTPKVDNTGISQESAIMKGLVGEGDVVPFKRRDWEALPQRVRQLSAEWYWAHSVEDGPEIDRLANQLATMGFDIDYDYDGENIELTNKKSNRKFLLSLEDADNFTGWAQGTEPGYDDLNENLRKWFKEKWVRFGPDGKIRGACARGSDSEGKPKCLPQKKAHALGKKGRKYAASKKRREDPNPERRGKAKNVATKKKSNEGVTEEQLDELKCWPGYTRVKGVKAGAPGSCKKKTSESTKLDEEYSWVIQHKDTKKVIGTFKNENDAVDQFNSILPEKRKKYVVKNVPHKHEQLTNENKHRKCPSCGGELVSEEMLNEKKDACYYKVKSRYKVWPSAYASGALVKCRKVGAKNWGKSTTKENKGLSMPGTYEQEYNMFKKKGPERITAMTYENQSTTEVIGPFKLLDIKDDIVTVKGHEPLRLSRLSKDKLTPGFNYAFEVSGNDIIKVILMTVDTVIHTDDAILMIKRKNQPFADHWALPGGFIDPGETPLQAAIRELQEETGLQITSAEPVGEFKTANRDPRMENTWSYAFKLYVKDRATVKAGDDASAAKWVPINKISTLPVAFDHRDIIKKALSGQIDESSPDFSAMFEAIEQDIMQEKWSAKYKRSINCNNPKGFSQRAHCQGRKKKGKK